MSKCIRAGRIFLARIINWIRTMNRKDEYTIPQEARRDIAWWGRCAQQFNGVSLIWLSRNPNPDTVIATDACKTGYGGIMHSNKQYFRGKVPSDWQAKNIAELEMAAVMVALKVWGEALTGEYFWILVDNEAVATVLNIGSSRHLGLQALMREIALLAAQHQFVIKAKHIEGVSNRLPDWLSRWDDPTARRQFRAAIQDGSWHHKKFSSSLFQLTHQW